MTMDDLPDIPGVVGPIEDPVTKHVTKYGNEITSILQLEQKSFLKPIYLMSSAVHYVFHKPASILHSLFDAIRVEQPRRFYHEKFRRVKEIWECEVSDPICIFEAEEQFNRDRRVDEEILKILQARLQRCRNQYTLTFDQQCGDVIELFESANNAYNIKYGELGIKVSAVNTLNKQKNRFIENRYLERVFKKKFNE